MEPKLFVNRGGVFDPAAAGVAGEVPPLPLHISVAELVALLILWMLIVLNDTINLWKDWEYVS